MVVCATALGQVTLERKYQEGSSYSVETVTHLRQTLTILGMNTETNSDTTSVSKITVGQRDGSGNLPLTENVESLQVNIGGTAGDYFFDSKNPDNKGTSMLEVIMRDIHKLIVKTPTTTVLDKDNNIAEVKVDQNLLGSLPVNLQDLVRDQFNPTKMKEAAVARMGQLPSDSIKPGDTWQRTEKSNLGAGQIMTFEIKYKYEGTIEKDGRTLDKITAQAQNVKFELEPNPALPLTLKGSDLKIAESDSSVLFDRKLGKAVENKELIRITGDIAFEANGMQLPSKLDLKIESEVKVLP
jgi:hypothetical protein